MKPMEPNTVKEEALAIRRAKVRVAVDRTREHARRTGLDKMTMEDIDAEVAAARRKRCAGK